MMHLDRKNKILPLMGLEKRRKEKEKKEPYTPKSIVMRKRAWRNSPTMVTLFSFEI